MTPTVNLLLRSFDRDASNFIDASYLISERRRPINDAVRALKLNGLWYPTPVIYPFACLDAAGNSWNLRDPSQFRITWNGTVTHNANGITGDGSTGYGDTGWNPIAMSADLSNFAMGVYTRGPTAAVGTSRIDLGSTNPASSHLILGWLSAGSEAIGAIGAVSGVEYSPTTNPTQREGLNVITTNGTRSQFYYNQGIPISTPETATGAVLNVPLFIGAANTGSGGTGFSLKNIAFVFVMGQSGLSATQSSTVYQIIQRYQTALGRAV